MDALSYKDAQGILNEIHPYRFRIKNYKQLKESFDAKKLKNYPHLGICEHFPKLKGIEFLTDDQISKVDKALALFSKNQYIYESVLKKHADLSREEMSRLFDFLEDNGIVEVYKRGACPHCKEPLSLVLRSVSEKNRNLLCPDCGEEFESAVSCEFQTVLKLIEEKGLPYERF